MPFIPPPPPPQPPIDKCAHCPATVIVVRGVCVTHHRPLTCTYRPGRRCLGSRRQPF